MNEETGNKTPGESSGKPSVPLPAVKVEGQEGKMTILARLAAAFGFGKGKAEESEGGTSDVGTKLAHERTDLAMDRSYLAAERTLMAWIRTSLAMISFGFTIGKLGQVINDIKINGIMGTTHTVSIEGLAYFLVIIGTAALILAALQHRHRVRELYVMGLRRQHSITFIIALLMAVVGGLALTALVLAL